VFAINKSIHHMNLICIFCYLLLFWILLNFIAWLERVVCQQCVFIFQRDMYITQTGLSNDDIGNFKTTIPPDICDVQSVMATVYYLHLNNWFAGLLKRRMRPVALT